MSQSKLSKALALTLMRYKEIDRDTIEALCKRAASLEQQTGDVLSTNAALSKSHTQLQWALRDLLAHTREYDDAGPEGEGYQSKALQNAIDTADALVGADVTDQFPIADEPLNRRIQELEVALAAEQKKKQGNVYIDKDLISLTQGGETGVRVGRVRSDERKMEDMMGSGAATVGERHAFIRKATEEAHTAVQKALQERLEDLIVKPAAELKPEMQPRRWSEQSLRALIRDVVSDTQTVDVPADFELHTVVRINGPVEATNKLVKEIIAQEMRPGGRIHAALIKR